MNTLGCAVVGLGIGEQLARTLAANRACHLRLLCDHDLGKAEKIAGELGAGRIVSDYQRILEDPEVNLVVIASYDQDHYAHTMAALEAGKHVFVEKPLCYSPAQLEAIRTQWKKAGGTLRLSTNHILRSAPLYRWLKERITAGDLGHIYALDGEYLYGRLEKIISGWRGEVVDYSVMLGGGIHMVDLMLWFAAEQPQTVYAIGNQISTEGTTFHSDDFVSATFQFPSGLVGRITANFGCVHRHHHVLRIYGTKGTFLYDDAGPRWHFSRDPGFAGSPIYFAPLPASKGGLLSAFVSTILEGTEALLPEPDVFDVLLACLASDQSLKQGAIVKIQR